MHCKLHDRMGAMRADRLGSPPSLALARRGIAAIGAFGYPKLSIVMKWVKRLQKGAMLRTASPIPGTS